MAEPASSLRLHSPDVPDVAGPACELDDVPLPAAALRKLLAWLSPSFPVGGFSYSHGLEWAIEDGTVTDAEGLRAWLADILRHGAGWSDAAIFHHAYRAAAAGNRSGTVAINSLAVALQPSKERHLESTTQGRAFLATVAATWPNCRLIALAEPFAGDVPVAYPVAVALASAAHDIPPAPAANACLAAFVANLVSAAVRAVPLGQTDGQRVVAALSPLVAAVADDAASASLERLGGSAWRADIASMKHETQYTRLFRS
jgi:urease accessory protein